MTSLKTRNARRTVYMNSKLKEYLLSLKGKSAFTIAHYCVYFNKVAEF